MKVMIILGTRPEIIRLSEVIKLVKNNFELFLVHTGQNYDYELNEIFFNDLALPKPDYFLNCKGSNPGIMVGQIISQSYKVLKSVMPDALLLLGDTNSCLSAYAAKRLKIPVFHMEAGNRCFDQRVPEEINRKIVDHLADINLPYSQISRSYLIAEGFDPEKIIVTGSPMFDVLNQNKTSIQQSQILSKFGLEPCNYIVVSVHREENIDNQFSLKNILNALNDISIKSNLRILFSVHPRTRNNIDNLGLKLNKNITLNKPLGFFDYNNLQINSKFVISDSGTIFEESSILKFKAIALRQTHERPEAFEEAGALLSAPDSKSLLRAFSLIKLMPTPSVTPTDYVKPFVAQKVVNIISSYVDHVNFYNWYK